MSGLEKILAKIADESALRVKHILDGAKSEAAKITEAAEKNAAEEVAAINASTERELETLTERTNAAVELRKRQSILTAKKEILNEIVEKTKACLEEMNDDQYIDVIQHLYEKHFPTKNAVIYFSEKDLKRIPEKVLDSFVAAAKKKKIKVTVSEEPAEIQNGFIIDYDGIIENCSFDALIEDHMLDIEDLIQKKCF